MSSAAIWLTMLATGVGTVVIRLSFLALIREETRVSVVAARILRLIPPAVLAAFVLPAILRPNGPWEVAFDNHRIAAAVVAGVVAWKTRHVVTTIVAGMTVLWVLQAIW